jgi:hypothetical protein
MRNKTEGVTGVPGQAFWSIKTWNRAVLADRHCKPPETFQWAGSGVKSFIFILDFYAPETLRIKYHVKDICAIRKTKRDLRKHARTG